VAKEASVSCGNYTECFNGVELMDGAERLPATVVSKSVDQCSMAGLRRLTIVIFGGQIVNFRSWLIRDLLAAGFRVVACGPDDYRQSRQITELGAEYVACPIDATGLNPIRDTADIRALAAVLRSIQPEVFLSFHTKYNVIGPIAASIAKVPRIYALIAGLGYGFSPGKELKRRIIRSILSTILKFSLHRCHGVFVQNEDDRNLVNGSRWMRSSAALVKLAGSGVDIDAFPHTELTPGPLKCLLIARMLKEKGVVEFAEAARIIKNKRHDCVFQLLGPIDRNPSALSRDMITSWEESGIIEYLGETLDVRPFLQASHVFVLPSYYREGIPRTILEALATGRAVITCDTPGCREAVVSEVNGFQVPPKKPSALAAAIEILASDWSMVKRMGKASRQIAEGRFDVRKVNLHMMKTMGLLEVAPAPGSSPPHGDRHVSPIA
jgi:glycosyltransferase involved in cell wall biosynthesis